VTGNGDIVDPATGLPRVLARKCGTCIYRPSTVIPAERREQMQRDAVANGAWIICHHTLPAAGETEQAVCRGFYDVARRDSWGLRLAHAVAVANGLTYPDCAEIAPPEHDVAR
jgi:hypothetical protein